MVVAALLVGFAVIYAQGTTQERNLAQTEAEKARQVSSIMIDLFELSAPEQALGDTITARELLDHGARQIRDELEDQPAVQATMMDATGQVYQKLGLNGKADSLLQTALDPRRRQYCIRWRIMKAPSPASERSRRCAGAAWAMFMPM